MESPAAQVKVYAANGSVGGNASWELVRGAMEAARGINQVQLSRAVGQGFIVSWFCSLTGISL